MRKILFILLLLVSCNLWADAKIKTIRFGTEATYPPFEYYDASGKIKGFDIDIANALCRELNAECSFSHQSFNSLIPSLRLGKFDALIASLGVTPERSTQVAFTNSYYEPSAVFIAASSNHLNLNDVNNKLVGVQMGSTFEKYMQEKYGNQIKLKRYASIIDAFLDLKAKRIDFVLADTPIAINWLRQNDHKKNFQMIGKPIVDHHYFGNGYAIAVNKNNIPLLDALNQALARIRANGIYDKIIKQYFN